MSTKIAFNVDIKAESKEELLSQLVDTAVKVVQNLSEAARCDLLVRLVVHALLLDGGLAEPLDTVDMLRDVGLYIGEDARQKQRELEGM